MATRAQSSVESKTEPVADTSERRGRTGKRKQRDDSGSDASPRPTGKRKSGPASKLSDKVCRERARDLVRLALANEIHRRPLKRDDIVKRILGQHGRAFEQVYKIAQEMLKCTFGYDLVELRAKHTGTTALVNSTSNGKNATREGNDGPSSDNDLGLPAPKRKAASSSTKQYILRSRLPEKMLLAASRVPPDGPADDSPSSGTSLRGKRDGEGLYKALELDRDAFEEWRADDGSLFDLKRGDSLPAMALVHVILAIILVNERSCPDDKFRVLLKAIGLRPATELPYNPSTAPALVDRDKITLDKVLDQLIRQGYIEKHVNKRLLNMQADHTSGDPSVEWTWGPRADAEIGEQHIASFISECSFATGTASDVEEIREKTSKDIVKAAGSKLSGPTGMQVEV